MLARVLNFLTAGARPAGVFVEPEATAEQIAAHHQALLEAAREQLREAHRARDQAARGLRETEDHFQKAREVVADAARANAASEEAERTARAAAQAWAAAGSPDDARPDPALLKRAGDAFNEAIDARVLADGARAALPALKEAVDDALLEVTRADERIEEAARAVEFAILEPTFARLERAARDWEEASFEVQSLAKAQLGNFNQPVRGGTGELLARLRALQPRRPYESPKHLLDAAELDRDRWNQFGKRLLEDPEANL